MFLRPNKEDLSWSRSKKALPIFALLWGTGLLLALIYIFGVRAYLQEIERNQAKRLLDSYLATNRSSRWFFGSRQLNRNGPLQGLSFIRITQGDDQVLMVDNQSMATNFEGLINLAPTSTGTWLPIEIDKKRWFLTVIVKNYDNGIFIQAGIDGHKGYNHFKRLTRNAIYTVMASLVLLWPFSLFIIKLSLSPLIATQKKITKLARQSKTKFLPEQGNGPELDHIYRQINQLIRQNRHLVAEMQQSLDNVAHDLRTPMTRLRSVAEYGLQAENDTKRLRNSLSDCLEESERVLAMLRVMMSVVEAESGTMQLELENCDLALVLDQVITLYEYVAEEQKILVSLKTNRPIPVQLDITRISQVCANLLDNAIKYNAKEGWVKIEVHANTKEVVVIFTDNGMGISAGEQERIWERLYRGDRSRSQKGLGLGLNYVQAVVAAHGGTAMVTSQLHKGSEFTVRLPRGQVDVLEKSQISGA